MKNDMSLTLLRHNSSAQENNRSRSALVRNRIAYAETKECDASNASHASTETKTRDASNASS